MRVRSFSAKANFYALYRSAIGAAALSPEAKKRLAWFDHYRRSQNVALTCRHFGISRKTFYAWQKRFAPHHLASLEGLPSVPKRHRHREITEEQEMRVVALRKRHLRYGKEKIAWLYFSLYHERISAWKVQKVIERYRLYYHPAKVARTQRRRRNALKKKRIIELRKREVSGFLICLDTIVIYWGSVRRYIFTAIDSVSKIAFARMYTTKSSYNGADFLRRLSLLLDGKIENVGHDNGSEFQKYFARACAEFGIQQYFSRPKTPKDNAICERFNRTLQDEFLRMGNFHSDARAFNQRLTDWLVEYNFMRPHQALGYVPPINFEAKYLRVLPTYPSSTNPCNLPPDGHTGGDMLPPFLRTLFWDTDADAFVPEDWPDYSIFRVLEYGDEDAVAWMRRTFSESEIRRVLRTERRLTRKSANFWALVYEIDQNDVAALRAEGNPLGSRS